MPGRTIELTQLIYTYMRFDLASGNVVVDYGLADEDGVIYQQVQATFWDGEMPENAGPNNYPAPAGMEGMMTAMQAMMSPVLKQAEGLIGAQP